MPKSPEQRPRRDEGFTLVEMSVAMLVLGLALSLVYSALVQIQQRTTQVEGQANAVAEVRQALQQIDRQVRSGNVLYSPENEVPNGTTGTTGCTAVSSERAGTCMRVYTQLSGVERCVQWQVLPQPGATGRSMLRTRNWHPDWETNGDLTAWSTVSRGLVAMPSKQPFVLVKNGAGAATAYDSRLLRLHFEAVDPRRSGTPVTLTSALSGRNTNYGYDAGLCTPVPPA